MHAALFARWPCTGSTVAGLHLRLSRSALPRMIQKNTLALIAVVGIAPTSTEGHGAAGEELAGEPGGEDHGDGDADADDAVTARAGRRSRQMAS